MLYNREPTWGQSSFDAEANWYNHLRHFGSWESGKELHQEFQKKAKENPEFDYFEHFLPTGRPKHDIGRYVMRHGINVPIIRSMTEWQSAILEGKAMIRSDMPQDYNGFSGLTSTAFIYRNMIPPRDIHGDPDKEYYKGSFRGEHRVIEGPLEASPPLLETGNFNFYAQRFGSVALMGAMHSLVMDGLYSGDVSPSELMRLTHWKDEIRSANEELKKHGFATQELRDDDVGASLWRKIPGVNIRVFKDNYIEGKYYIGGSDSHHEWTITEGRDSADIEAHDKAVYRGYRPPGIPEYVLPTRRIVDLYEKVRGLPYFDTTQTPLLELQYGEDGKLYFLQYLKTGATVSQQPVFELPHNENTVVLHDVRGVTGPEGEKVRLYNDPYYLSERMHEQAIWVGYDGRGLLPQVASKIARFVFLDDGLNFKDNHYDSAPLYMAETVLSPSEEFERRMPSPVGHEEKTKQVGYINAIITSNGQQATIESDWEPKIEQR